MAEWLTKTALTRPIDCMRSLSRLLLLGGLAVSPWLTSCSTGPLATSSGANYHVVAHRPSDPDKVRVKVSLSKQNIYVMEGERCLMAVACSVGIPAKPTPKGNFKIYAKNEHKRSGSYGFSVKGNRVVPATSAMGGHLCRLSDGLLVRICAGLWIPSGLRAPGSAQPRLHPYAWRSGAEILRLGAYRHAGEHRDHATGRRHSWPKVARIDDSQDARSGSAFHDYATRPFASRADLCWSS